MRKRWNCKRDRKKVSEIVASCHESSSDISDIVFSDELLEKLKVVENLSIVHRKNTGIYHILVVMILYKIIHPKQNIRKCQESTLGGFSARSFEEKCVLEILTERNLALRSDSAWLTRSLICDIYNHRCKAKFAGGVELRGAFLDIVDSIQNQPENHRPILRFLFNKVTMAREAKKVRIDKPNGSRISPEKIVKFVEEQMFYNYGIKGGARFCEITCHSMMRTAASQIEKYRRCMVRDLNQPCVCDKSSKSSGDVELYDGERLVLSLETKLNIPIRSMIFMKSENKIEKHSPDEYHFVFFSKVKTDEHAAFESFCDRIQEMYGCQISMWDGIKWLRNFLCLITDPAKFLTEYLDAVEKDEYLMKAHKEKTNELVMKYFGSTNFCN